MNDARLLIDGIDVPINDTIRLFQRQPWPAGHRYELTITGREVNRRLKSLALVRPIPSRTQKSLFFVIEGLVHGIAGEPAVPARFVLNSVESVVVENCRVTFSGVCSPVLFE